MSEKTLFEEGFQTGEITPTFDQLKQQISELQKECEKLSIQLAAYEKETTKEKKVSPHTPYKRKEKANNNDSKMGLKFGSENESKNSSHEAFVSPTLEEVQAYMDEIGEHRFTAVKFWSYYEARGWTLGKAKMKFWKRVLDNWSEKENIKEAKHMQKDAAAPRDNVVTFHAYKPVDNTGAVTYEEYERMKREGKL